MCRQGPEWDPIWLGPPHPLMSYRLVRFLYSVLLIVLPDSLWRRDWKYVERRLKRRGPFPAEAWRNSGVGTEAAKRVLEAIADAAGIGSYSFIPQDDISCVGELMTSWHVEDYDLHRAIEERGIAIDHDAFQAAAKESKTVGDFVSLILVSASSIDFAQV